LDSTGDQRGVSKSQAFLINERQAASRRFFAQLVTVHGKTRAVVNLAIQLVLNAMIKFAKFAMATRLNAVKLTTLGSLGRERLQQLFPGNTAH
jgi:hypothetical protein